MKKTFLLLLLTISLTNSAMEKVSSIKLSAKEKIAAQLLAELLHDRNQYLAMPNRTGSTESCPGCLRSAPSTNRHRHMMKCCPAYLPIKCSYCDQRYETERGLKSHMAIRHKDVMVFGENC